MIGRLKASVIISSTILLAACETTQNIKPKIELEPLPALPTIHRDDLSCLSNETQYKLVLRDHLKNSAVEECRTAVETYNDEK